MFKTTRRNILLGGAGLGTLATFGSPFLSRSAHAQAAMFAPEPGAEITLLRWKRFVQSEEDAFLKLAADFTAKTGVKVNVQSEFSMTCSQRHRLLQMWAKVLTWCGVFIHCRTCSPTSLLI